MDDFCGSKFWDWDVTWNTEDPDLTQCFQKTALVWIPTAFLWIFTSFVYIFRPRFKKRRLPWSPFNILKIVLCVLLMFLQIVQLVDEVGLNAKTFAVYPLDICNPILELVTYSLALAAVVLSRNFGIPSCSVQFVFWFLKMVCKAVPFRTALRTYSSVKDDSDQVLLLVEIISYPLIVAQFLLNCWADFGADFQKPRNDKSKPQSRASALSKLLFCWFDSMAWKGFRKPLDNSDLWDLDPELTTAHLVSIFEDNWAAKLKKNKNAAREGTKPNQISVLSVLLASFGTQYFLWSSLRAVPDLLTFVSPYVLNLLIDFVNGNEEPWKGYFYASLLIITDLILILTRNHHLNMMFAVAFRVKSVLTSAVYRKALVLSNATRRERTVGEIVNLMSVDVAKVFDVIPFSTLVWTAPLQIGVSIYFLWLVIGPSALAGLAVMLLLIPTNGVVSTKLRAYQVTQMKKKDERVKLMSEILSGIKILKLYAWEPSYQAEILKIREMEMKTLKAAAYASAFNDFMWACSQFLATLATFATFVLIDEKNILDAKTAFVSLALLKILSLPLAAFPMDVALVVKAAVSLKRLGQFMNSDEINFGAVSHDQNEENGSFSWSGPGENVLENVNLRIRKGSLVAVVGTVGSGKSSLLSAMLGEMEITSGHVNTIGNVSYASQIPWIQNATLRENILFGKNYQPSKYNKVIDACCLNPDLDIFAGRDKIEIGEKGINLSGGQKQRVSVARAVYNKAGIYLFDDPLSAVDAHVGMQMFDNVFGPNGLLKKKTRVLVTHAITFLPQVDQIIVLKKGRISEIGTYQELLDREGEFSAFVAQYKQSETDQTDDLVHRVQRGKHDRLDSTVSECSDISGDYEATRSLSLNRPSISSTSLTADTKGKNIPEVQKLIGEEFKETTTVPWSLYFQYFKASGWTYVIVSLLAYTLFQVFAMLANVWLSVWSETEVVNGTQPNQGYNIGIYAGLGVLQSGIFVIASILMCLANLASASAFHSEMLYRILRAPMWFFDTTPTGRILNRFAKDVDVLDNSLSILLRNCFRTVVAVLGTLVLITYNLPLFAVVCVPLAAYYYIVQKVAIPTSRQLRRLESVTRSPIYSNFSETISGASTIRAYGQSERFVLEAESKIDSNQTCYYPSIISNSWLRIRLESIGSLIVFFTATFSVMSMDVLSPGTVGLSISYALRITFLLSYFVRSFCGVESNIVAVERLKEYCQAPQEAEWESVQKPPKPWPAEGSVEFDNYETRYREGLDLVLKNVSFSIRAGEKIGVVGRTGAGKSSLTLALFRLVEGARGRILIDGKDISKIGLHELRGKITIIPQDPVLFSGTLRFNLDPFDNYTDHAIWKALELSHLSQFVICLPTQLSHKIAEGGDNLSVGQKQLVCLTRALLRKSKILVLDEATAAIDLETDDLIQQTIRTEFLDSTVITIAHRLNTIMDSTRILVLDNGFIREYDSPSNLLRDHESQFYQMARDAGLSSS